MDSARNRAAERTALYRLFNEADELIYLGVTFDLKQRLYQHARDKPWWNQVARQETEWHDSREPALAEESRLLEIHDPRYNSSRSRAILKQLNGRIDAAAARAGMSRARWLREITEEALAESEEQADLRL